MQMEGEGHRTVAEVKQRNATSSLRRLFHTSCSFVLRGDQFSISEKFDKILFYCNECLYDCIKCVSSLEQ
jgi:hypothetical protein